MFAYSGLCSCPSTAMFGGSASALVVILVVVFGRWLANSIISYSEGYISWYMVNTIIIRVVSAYLWLHWASYSLDSQFKPEWPRYLRSVQELTQTVYQRLDNIIDLVVTHLIKERKTNYSWGYIIWYGAIWRGTRVYDSRGWPVERHVMERCFNSDTIEVSKYIISRWLVRENRVVHTTVLVGAREIWRQY